KRRLAWVLYLPALVATVIFSFVVYAKFSFEQGVAPSAVTGGNAQAAPGVTMIGAMASQLIQVRDIIVNFVFWMSFFSALISAWSGSGLIAEDRRVGAHLLYFARPLTLFDYLLGKLLVVGAFALAGVLGPGLVICTVAAFASPEWSFVTEQGM